MCERYQALERRLMEKRKDGQLGQMLVGPLPGESLEDLKHAAREDEANAQRGVVELIKDAPHHPLHPRLSSRPLP